jgi:hypothetical protein
MFPTARLDLMPLARTSLSPSRRRVTRGAESLTTEPDFDLLVASDADVRAGALRALLVLRDPSLFVVICAAEAIDELMRARDGLPPAPQSWRSWRGVVPGPILAMAADQRLVWALEFAGKLLQIQRYPAGLVATAMGVAPRSWA